MRSANEPCPLKQCDGSGFVTDHEAFTTRECACRPARIAAAKAKKLKARVPRIYQGVGFDREPVPSMDPTVVAEVRRFVHRLDDNLDGGRGLWLTGDIGTGKTTLAMIISLAALERGRSVAIYSLPHLLWVLRSGYDDDARLSYLEILDALTAVDLLHIDDVGAENSSDWVLEQLYAIINTRYEDGKSIVFTTNLDPTALGEQIGERTASRLMEMCGDPLALFGDDQRRAKLDADEPPRIDRWEPPARYGDQGAAVSWPGRPA